MIYASDDEIDSLDFSHSSYHDDFETSPQAQNVPLLRNDQAMMNPTINSQLLGTTEERDILRNEMDRAYCKSLAKDMEKEKSNEKYKQSKSEQIFNNRENAAVLMEQRKSRSIPEPDLLEDHVVVSVRHTTRGIVRRLFLAEHTMNVVYDWIGSLQELPMYFNLIDFKGDILKPFESAGDVKSALNMAECDNPPSLEEDEEITMSGFSASESIPVKDRAYDIGNDETQRFLTQLMNQELDRPPDSPVLSSLKCSCDTESMIKTYVKNLDERCTAAALILCHRDTVKFWDLVFRQNIDLSTNEIKVIWAGEAGADCGGLYREFLLFAMENFVNLSTHLFGASRYAFFSSFPAHISAKRYILLGQICARSILHIGRGPSCLHPLLVKAIFEHSLDVPIHLNQFEGELLYKIKQLESGDNTSLIDANVVPTNGAAKNIELFVNAFGIITKYAAIEQFRKGIFSICPKLLEYPCCFSKYFTDEKPSVKLAK